MATQLLHRSGGVALQMASPPFVQPAAAAGVIPKPQRPETRKQAGGETVLGRRNLTSLSGSEQRF